MRRLLVLASLLALALPGVAVAKTSTATGKLTHKVRLPRDISAKAGWCIVEAVSSGSEIAAIDFKLAHNPFE